MKTGRNSASFRRHPFYSATAGAAVFIPFSSRLRAQPRERKNEPLPREARSLSGCSTANVSAAVPSAPLVGGTARTQLR
ncbi:hypothetical protein NDU88_000949 [Pleurodeles waltl]|uniref:Uncharacterized protein n=1 Tax=Pleurodeles waltl TaxID=8319 RepID=A0AAV7N9J9_PLEWA|nr:hypothetical protein NDU88_000949 [Pleurodeles waltl]